MFGICLGGFFVWFANHQHPCKCVTWRSPSHDDPNKQGVASTGAPDFDPGLNLYLGRTNQCKDHLSWRPITIVVMVPCIIYIYMNPEFVSWRTVVQVVFELQEMNRGQKITYEVGQCYYIL